MPNSYYLERFISQNIAGSTELLIWILHVQWNTCLGKLNDTEASVLNHIKKARKQVVTLKSIAGVKKHEMSIKNKANTQNQIISSTQ